MKRLLSWSVAVAIIFCFGELAARLDDWIFQDVPFLANPNRERDLILHDSHTLRGRPGGRFKKYELNSFGFRGPEIDRERPPGTTRIMILGASETFGLYESKDREYPALLREAFLKAGDKVEIVNAAIAGMTLPSLTDHWKHWAKDFKPDIAVIYPSPQFYLDNETPRAAIPKPNEPVRGGVPSRFLERLIDTAKQSSLLKALRARYVLWRDLKGKEDAWFFRSVPEDRLADFRRDLETLADDIAASGARPVLVTHAFKTASPPSVAESRELEAFRIFFPRAEPAVLSAFDSAANQAIRELGRKRGWTVIDAANDLNGRTLDFADPVHFNDAGSKAMANILFHGLLPLVAAKEGG